MKALAILLTAAAGVMFLFANTGRARLALAYGWFCAILLMPSWTFFEVMGQFRMDAGTVVAATGALLFLIKPEHGPKVKFSLSDMLVIALFCTINFSQYQNGDFGPTTPLAMGMHWVIPYVVGRHFFGSVEDARSIERFVPFVAVMVTFYGMVEAVTHINPAIKITGMHFYLLEMEGSTRMGMTRAQVMSCHPIFFGLMMVLLLPFAIEAAKQAREGNAPFWQRIAPLVVLVGAMTSLSRGPVLAYILTWGAVIFFRRPKLRTAMLSMAILGGIVIWTSHEAIMTELAGVVGESEENATIMVINGEPVKYTGTKHRVLQFKAYNQAIQDAGYLGYGEMMEEIKTDKELHPIFKQSIDNQYLVIYLRHGMIGLSLFVALGALTIYRLARLAWYPSSSPLAPLAGALCGGFVAVTAMLGTVYLPYDLGAFWLMYAGFPSSLAAVDAHERALHDEQWEDAPDWGLV